MVRTAIKLYRQIRSVVFNKKIASLFLFFSYCHLFVLSVLVVGVTDGPDSTALQIRVAKLITSVPERYTKEEYFMLLSIQIIDLIKFGVDIKDIILQKVCVMIITRISYLCPSICDQYLLIPLAQPLLNIDISHRKNNQINIDKSCNEKNENIVISDDEIRNQGSTVSDSTEIELTVIALHCLVILCPLQTPLQSSIIRCNICKVAIILCLHLMSEDNNNKLLPILNEFIYTIFENSTDITLLALQIQDVVISQTINCFEITFDKKLIIRERKNDSISNNSGKNNLIGRKYENSASELSNKLGISQNVLPGNVSQIFSPQELLSSIRSHDNINSDKTTLLNSSNKIRNHSERSDFHSNGESKVKREGKIGKDMEEIFSMAAIAAQNHENETEIQRNNNKNNILISDTLKESPHTRVINSLCGINDNMDIDRKDELDGMVDTFCSSSSCGGEGRGSGSGSGEDRGSVTNDSCTSTSNAHQILEVSVRARLCTELFLSYNNSRSISSNKTNEKNNEKKESNGKINYSKNDESGGDVDDIGSEKENIISQLFINCLSAFLGLHSPQLLSIEENNNLSLKLKGATDPVEFMKILDNIPKKSTVDQSTEVKYDQKINNLNFSKDNNNVKNGLSGLFLLILQNHIPMNLLLEGGK